jgi:hypothetical protein
MAIVNTSQNLTAVTYATGETITIRDGAVLTVNSTPATLPGTIQCLTSGKLRVENTSTTTPIVLALNFLTNDFQFESNGIFEIRGNMIEIDTGTGAAQSWDFSTLYSGVLTDITYVEVETAVGSNDYMPWYLVDIAPAYYSVRIPTLRSTVKADFDSAYEVMFYNSDTRLLESGDGTNGKSVPSGCKIRIPNILITNQDFRSDVSAAHAILSQGTPTGGDFTITVTNRRTNTVIGTTAAIPFNATAAQLDTALEAVLGAGTITPGGGPLPTSLTATLAGAFATIPLAFTVNSNVTGGTLPIIFSRDNNAASFTLVDLNPSGTLDAEYAMFSRKIRIVNTTFASIRMFHVGTSGDLISLSSSTGSVTLDHFITTPNCYTQAAASLISTIFGNVTLNKCVTIVSSGQLGITYSVLPALQKFDDVRHLSYALRSSTSGAAVVISTIKPGVPIIRHHCLGSELNLANLIDNPIVSMRHNDTLGTAQPTLSAVYALTMANCVNIIFSDFQKYGFTAPRNQLFFTDPACVDIKLLSGSYNCSDNAIGLLQNNGVGFEATNFNITNLRTGSVLVDHPATFLGTRTKVKKVLATVLGTSTVDSGQDAEYDVLSCSIADFNEINASVNNFVGSNFADYGTTPTTGHVTFGAFGSGTGLTLTGAAYTSQTGFVLLPTAADSFIAEIPFAMHAITSFQNAEPSFILQGEGVFSNRHTVINSGGVTGGTFTISVYDTSNNLVGTTAALNYNSSTTSVDPAIEAVVGTGVTVSGSLLAGYLITMPIGTIYRITTNGANLTGGAEPGIAYAYGRALLTANETLGANLTLEYQVRNGGEAVWPGSWSSLSGANLSTAIAGLTGYNANTAGLEMRIRATNVAAGPYCQVQQVSMPTNIAPAAWTVDDAELTLQGPSATDDIVIKRASDNAVLYTFTGSGTKTFTVGNNYNVEVYFCREDSTGTVLMRTLPKTYRITFGDNGSIPLFYGDEVQLAQVSEILAIKTKVDAFLDATISSRSTQTSVDKTLTVPKFLALK